MPSVGYYFSSHQTPKYTKNIFQKLFTPKQTEQYHPLIRQKVFSLFQTKYKCIGDNISS
jgi:hypothetical protein